MKRNLHTKVYGVLGKVLCAGAGAIVGFITGGIGFAAVGLLAGFSLGRFLENALVSDP